MPSPHEQRTDPLQTSSELETLGRIAAFAAHDLDNLLQAVLSNLELLDERPEMLPMLLDQLVGAVSTASALTSQLRPSSPSNANEARPYELSRALRANERFLGNALPKNVKFRIELPPSTPMWVAINPLCLQRALLNLIINAAEAIGDRAGLVRVLLEEESPVRARIVVADDGPGMDEETAGRIQRAFYTTKKEGQGIGLASARDGILLHGGDLRIESSPGSGTRATILLPRVQEPPARQPPPRTSQSRSGAGRRVLVVEDNPFVRQVLAATLGHKGYAPFCAMSGNEALDLVRTVDDFAIAILDVSLSGSQDGIQLMDVVRTHAPTLPIVLMSGSDLRSQLDSHQGMPPDGILSKPFKQVELLELFDRLAPLPPSE